MRPPISTSRCGSPSCTAIERTRPTQLSRLQATTLLLRSIATVATWPSPRAISSQRRAPVEAHRRRGVEEMPRQQRQIGGLIGLLALGIEELPQLAAGCADEQGGTVDLDRVDPARRPRADPRLQLDRNGLRRDRRAAHDPFAAAGEHLQQAAGHEPADRVLLVAGEPKRDRFVVEAGAGVEVERMAGPGRTRADRAGHASRRSPGALGARPRRPANRAPR